MSASSSNTAHATGLSRLEERAVFWTTEPALWLCLGLFFNISGLTDYVSALSSVESLVFAAGVITACLRLWLGPNSSQSLQSPWVPAVCAVGFGILASSLVTSFIAGHNLSILEDFGWRHFAKFMILVTLGLTVYPDGTPRKWIMMTLEVGLAALAASVLYRFHILEQFNYESGRMELAGRHGDPNFACLFMTIGLVLALQKLTEARNALARITHLLAAGLFLFTAWFTESRAGLAIMALVGFGALLLFPFGKMRKYLLIAIPVVAMICLATFGERILDRYMSIDDASNSGRLAGIMATKDMIFEHPFLGHGYNSSSLYVGRYQDTLFASNSVALEIHTTPFQIAGELGLFGLLAYGALYASTLFLALKRFRASRHIPSGSITTILIITAILMNMISIPMTYIGTVHGIALILLFNEIASDTEH